MEKDYRRHFVRSKGFSVQLCLSIFKLGQTPGKSFENQEKVLKKKNMNIGMPVSTIVENTVWETIPIECHGEGVSRTGNVPSQPSRRPGPKSSVPDESLSPFELDKRNKIRQRNKEAAQRVRDRRVLKLKNLENQIAELEQEKKMLQDDNTLLRCALMAKNKREGGNARNDQPSNFHRQVSNTDMPDEAEFGVAEESDFGGNFEPSACYGIEVYENGTGHGALLVNSENAFVLTPLKHQIQLTISNEPKRPTSVYQLNEILNSL